MTCDGENNRLNHGVELASAKGVVSVFQRLGLVAALLVIALVAAACGGGGQQSSSSSSTQSTQSAGGEVQRIEVSGTDFAYAPNNLTVRRGVPVEIVFKNNGRVAHDLVIRDLNVSSPSISPGQTTTIRFTPERAGEYRIVCTEPGHEASGMVATLVVQ